MTDVVENLWFAHLLLTGEPPYELAIDQAERLLRDLPPSGSRDDGLEVVEAARRGDAEARGYLANSLYHLSWLMEHAEKRKRATRSRSQGKPTLARLVAKARQFEVDVTIDPNGTATFRTGNSAKTTAVDSPKTELDEWIAKHAH